MYVNICMHVGVCVSIGIVFYVYMSICVHMSASIIRLMDVLMIYLISTYIQNNEVLLCNPFV